MKILTTYSIGDEDGVYVFDDGTVWFWTAGRGGFIMDGTMGIWPPTDDYKEQILARHEWTFSPEYDTGKMVTLKRWLDLPPDILGKAVLARQPTRPSKYSLIGALMQEVYHHEV
jgi:hypothetical protein